MGVVWKGRGTRRLRRHVALKFVSAEALADEELKTRLIREAQAAAALDHPHICAVHGIHEEDGETFIAMAYIDGPSLAERIKERPLPLDEALDIAIQIAGGLEEAQEKGVVHRDIKPANVMLTAKGQVKIMDFGLATLAGWSRITKRDTTVGTPAYMAPEQLEGREADRRADIWALGCVLYEMLTQRSPFEADTEQAIRHGVLSEEPEPVTALRSGLPVEIDRLLEKALAKTPGERYQHVEDMLVDLRSAQRKSVSRKLTSAKERAARGLAPAGSAETASRWRMSLAATSASVSPGSLRPCWGRLSWHCSTSAKHRRIHPGRPSADLSSLLQCLLGIGRGGTSQHRRIAERALYRLPRAGRHALVGARSGGWHLVASGGHRGGRRPALVPGQ